MNTPQKHTGTRILFLRRPATELDDQNRICGSLDLPLSREGEIQARQLAELLQHVDLDCVVTAAGKADLQAAEIIFSDRKLKRVKVAEWRNLDHGLWHGSCLDELKATHPRYYRQWCENPDKIAPPGGETTAELTARVQPAFAKLLKKRTGESLAIIAPAPLLSVLIALAGQANCECTFGQSLSTPAFVQHSI